LISPRTGGTGSKKTGWSIRTVVADQGTKLRFSLLHRTITAWTAPDILAISVEAASADSSATRTATVFAFGVVVFGGKFSPLELVSILSYFK